MSSSATRVFHWDGPREFQSVFRDFLGHEQSSASIPFNQSKDIIPQLDPQHHNALITVNRKYQGLCDIICNLVLTEDLLGRGSDSNYLKDRITIQKLDADSHILKIYSLFRRMIAVLFGIYPDNLFSFREQWQLLQWQGANRTWQVHRQLLEKGLINVPEGETLKLGVITRCFLSLNGHSLLVKKTGRDAFILFDPNSGEHRGLTFIQLCDAIDHQITRLRGKDILFIQGKDYLARLRQAHRV